MPVKKKRGDSQFALRAVRLVELNVKEVDFEGSAGKRLKVIGTIRPDIVKEDEKQVRLSCDVTVGFKGRGPFNISARFDVHFLKKAEGLQGTDLLKQFRELSYPICAVISKLVSDITWAMGVMPLILAVTELQSWITAEKKETNVKEA